MCSLGGGVYSSNTYLMGGYNLLCNHHGKEDTGPGRVTKLTRTQSQMSLLPKHCLGASPLKHSIPEP